MKEGPETHEGLVFQNGEANQGCDRAFPSVAPAILEAAMRSFGRNVVGRRLDDISAMDAEGSH